MSGLLLKLDVNSRFHERDRGGCGIQYELQIMRIVHFNVVKLFFPKRESSTQVSFCSQNLQISLSIYDFYYNFLQHMKYKFMPKFRALS